jgi:hypothetical protein
MQPKMGYHATARCRHSWHDQCASPWARSRDQQRFISPCNRRDASETSRLSSVDANDHLLRGFVGFSILVDVLPDLSADALTN